MPSLHKSSLPEPCSICRDSADRGKLTNDRTADWTPRPRSGNRQTDEGRITMKLIPMDSRASVQAPLPLLLPLLLLPFLHGCALARVPIIIDTDMDFDVSNFFTFPSS